MIPFWHGHLKMCLHLFFKLFTSRWQRETLAISVVHVTAINPWSFTASCTAGFLKHSFLCLSSPLWVFIYRGIYIMDIIIMVSQHLHPTLGCRSNILTHPLKEHEGVMFSYESKSKIYILFRLFLFSIMESKERRKKPEEKMKCMGFDLWINQYHLSLVL